MLSTLLSRNVTADQAQALKKKGRTQAIVFSLLGLVAFALPGLCAAATFTDIITNLTDPVTQSETLIAAVCYIIGFVFFLIAFIGLRGMGNPQQQPGKLAGIILAAAAGVGLVYFPSTIDTTGNTVFGGSQASQGAEGGSNLIQ